MKVTADTITDEQIRELRRLLTQELGVIERVLIDCNRAEGFRLVGIAHSYRARCAEAWNARHGGES